MTDTSDPGPGRGHELLAYDPDNPHDPTRPESSLPDPEPGREPVPSGLVACPTCGTGVSPDRLRG